VNKSIGYRRVSVVIMLGSCSIASDSTIGMLCSLRSTSWRLSGVLDPSVEFF